MGLLKMVGSIGGILAGLQSMSGGSNGGDAFGELLSQLQQPLGGMATGFASSLFGLFGSLVVGLLGRYAHQAASQLKVEFESWLAAVAQIDTHSSGATATGGGMSHADMTKMTKLLSDIAANTAKAGRALDATVVLLGKLAEGQGAIAGAVAQIDQTMTATTAFQDAVLVGLGTMKPTAPALAELSGDVRGIGERLAQLDRHMAGAAGFHESVLTELRTIRSAVPALTELGVEMRGVGDRISQHIDHGLRTIGETTDHMAEKLDIRQSELMDQLANRQATMLRNLSGEIARLQAASGPEAASPQLVDLLTRLHQDLSSRTVNATVDLSRMEEVMTDGFQEISRNMEAAFEAFAQVSRLAAKGEEKAEDDLSDFFPDDFVQTTETMQPTISAGAFAEALARRSAQAGK
jgi:hypothetical protein